MLNILITSAGGNGAGNQVAKSLQHVQNNKYSLFYADYNPNNIQFTDGLVFDLPLVSDNNYLDELFTLINNNQINVIIPGSDKEILFFAENIKIFKDNNILIPINNLETINLCFDKSALNDKLIELNYLPPKSIKFSLHQDLPIIDWYPIVLKPSGGGGGSANVFIAQNQDELIYLTKYLNQAFKNEQFILQEYVGAYDSEFTVGILHDLNGDFIDSIAMNRDLSQSISVRSSVTNNTGREELGSNLVISSGVSQGVMGKFTEVTSQCKEIADSIGSQGPLNIQCRFVEGKVRVFEINPRYSGTTYFRSLAGFNEADLLIKFHLLNENIKRNISWSSYHAIRSLNETIFDIK